MPSMKGTITSAMILFKTVCLMVLLGFVSCSDDITDDVVSKPRNLFAGVADGRDFKTTSMLSIKDSSDIFLMIGRMNGNQSLLAAFNGKEEKEYPVADEGPLADLAEYLNGLIMDSLEIDTSILEDIFADSAELIPPGTSFMFYGIGEELYFSTRGSIYLTTFDGTINRTYGTIEAEFTNALSGVKYINALFEDVFFLDCPSLENCIE